MRLLRRTLATALVLLVSSVAFGPVAPPARADCPIVMQQATYMQSAVAIPAVDSLDPPDVPTRNSGGVTCLRDGGGGGGGGGPAPPCSTDCTPNWVPIRVNDLDTSEIENPLSRFDEFRVDRGDPDRVVALSPVPYQSYMGDVLVPFESLTEGDITSAMLYFGIQDGTGMAAQIEDLLGGNPTFDSTRQTAVSLLLNDQFYEAARALLATHTAADVTVGCGSQENPLQLRWVVGIPISIPCTQGELPKKVPVLVRATSPTYVLEEFNAEQNDPDGLRSVNLSLTVGPSSDASRSLVGFLYKRHGFSAHTATTKAFQLSVLFDKMDTTQGNTTATTFTTVVPGIPSTGTFAPGDVLYYNERGSLARGTSLGIVLQTPPTGTLDGLRMSSLRTGRDPPDVNWDMRVLLAPEDAGKLDHWKGMAELTATHALALGFARTTKLQLTHWAHSHALGTRYFLNLTQVDGQPLETPLDKAEVRATLYAGAHANATVYAVGLPTRSRLIFDAADEPGDPVARVDVTRDRFSSTGYFRTVLITGHSAHLPFSATGNYTQRTILQSSATDDPFGPSASGPALAQGMHSLLTWAGLWVNRTDTSDGNHYVNTTRATDNTIRFYFARGQGAQAVLSDPPLAQGEMRLVPDTPGQWKRYDWAMPDTGWEPPLPPCPAMASGACL